MNGIQSLCVFCGARAGSRPLYAEHARRFGTMLAEEGIHVVYGGSSLGLMAEVANAALGAGGKVTGVIPDHLLAREIPHDRVTELHVVDSMHERKAMMFDLSDAFVALPGGLGTLEELFEIATWSQIGLHVKPVGVLDVDGYFTPLAAFLDHAVEEGFVSAEDRKLLVVDTDPSRLLRRLREFEPPPTEGWIDPSSR